MTRELALVLFGIGRLKVRRIRALARVAHTIGELFGGSRLSIGSHERIRLCTLSPIFLEAGFQALKSCRTSIERNPQRSAVSLDFKNGSRSKSSLEWTIRKRDHHTFSFSQGFGFHGLRACNEANSVGFTSIELPFWRVEK